MGAVWTCRVPTCGVVAETKTETCPKCGGPMKRVGEAPWRGWVMILCGVILVGMMGAIVMAIGPQLHEAATTGASENFTGTPEQARAMLYLFYTIIAFGVLALVNGVYQLVTGAQHKIFIVLTVALFAVLLFFVWQSLKDMK